MCRDGIRRAACLLQANLTQALNDAAERPCPQMQSPGRGLSGGGRSQLWPRVANMPTAAIAMTAVAAHPTAFNPLDRVNRPMTLGRTVSNIIITMTGTATSPLITALQNNA